MEEEVQGWGAVVEVDWVGAWGCEVEAGDVAACGQGGEEGGGVGGEEVGEEGEEEEKGKGGRGGVRVAGGHGEVEADVMLLFLLSLSQWRILEGWV